MPRYFSFAELTHTDTGLANIPNWDQVENLKELAYWLDDVREYFGSPIRVNSAFRSKAVNARLGGVTTSAHLDGFAADICAWSGKESDNRRLLNVLKTYTVDQLIHYHAVAGVESSPIRFIHVGLKRKNGAQRMQILCK